MTEQKIINTNNDPTTTSSGNSNVSIKVIIPTDPASNMSVTKLSSEFHQAAAAMIINTNNDPTTTSSGNSNVSIKVIIPTDPASNMSVTKLSSEFHVEWEVHGMTGDPEFLIQAYSMLQTLPYPLPLPIWEKPPTVKSSEGSYKFTIDPTKFQVDTWYTIRISDVNNEDINETSDPFLVTK
ncbi:hypothetical protein Glove_682g62 [Diversispora epigaea]|uniref:Uncharacterized protein n=1 Tax=Diversispora epigaea TaxID=1348612 RepID=A0A397G2H7_9GLOM|nr:hypothetical protein Glove_682g62 [Diversispora epigaea]